MLLAAIALVATAILLRVTGTYAQALEVERALKVQPSSCSASLVSKYACDGQDKACTLTNIALQKEVRQEVQAAIAKNITLPKVEANTNPIIAVPEIKTEESLPSPAVNLNSDLIFDLTNEYRAKFGLAPFEKEEKVCNLAEIRTGEIASELAGNGALHSGLYNRNLPYWIFENAKVGSDEQGTLNWWVHSPIHRQSIVNNYKYSCVKCNGSICSQLFTSYEAKGF